MKELIDSVLERSLTLEERLQLRSDQVLGIKNDLAEERLRAWRKASGLPENKFMHQLSLANGDIENVKAKLGADLTSVLESFDWYNRRYELIERLLTAPYDSTDEPPISSVPLPYTDVLCELAQEAERRLVNELVEPNCLYRTQGLYGELRKHLFAELHDLTSLAIYEHVTEGRLEVSERNSETDFDHHKYMKTEGWARLFEKKPVAIRLIDLAITQWVNQSKVFIFRLHNDEDAIRSFLGIPRAEHLLVKSIEFGLSDPHLGGQAVAHFEFQGGRRLIYKSRSINADRAWSRLLKWMKARAFKIDLKVPAVIDCGNYGWVANITTQECLNDTQIQNYFFSAQCWTALLHIMNSKDFHEENVIAAGGDFIPIDFEATMSAADGRPLHTSPEMEAVNDADKWVDGTVATTGVLPTSRPALGGGFCLVGALTPSDVISNYKTLWILRKDATFEPELISFQSQKKSGLPQQDGQQAVLYDYQNFFLEGLEYTLQFIQAQKSSLIEDDELTSWFCEIQVRRIVRPTAFCSLLLSRLHDPRSWADGVCWSAQVRFFDRLPPTTPSEALRLRTHSQ